MILQIRELVSKANLSARGVGISRPPIFLGLQTFDQETICSFFTDESSKNKNLAESFATFTTTIR